MSAPVDTTESRFRQPEDVLGRVYAVTALVRAGTAIHAIVMNLWMVLPEASNRAGVVAACVVIAVWTTLISVVLRLPRRRTWWVFAADLLVTLAVVLATPLVVDGVQPPLTLAAFWGAGAPVYAAILVSTRWGLVQAAVVSAAYLSVPPMLMPRRIDLTVLVILTTLCLGALTGQFKATLEEHEKSRARSAALAERERLARIVHDGALQVLALMEREGPALGPKGVRLAALARESETQLRTLLFDRDTGDDVGNPLVDLAAALDKFQSARVTVSTMAGPVMVPRCAVAEVEATLSEALANVEKHAGPDASTWVLLDQETNDEVILWVRDNGVGMSPDEVAGASDRGRLGIRHSIVGRMASLHGSALLKSTPGLGTEWELRFPIDAGE